MDHEIVNYFQEEEGEDQVSLTIEDNETPQPDSDSESSSSRCCRLLDVSSNLVERIESGNRDYEILKSSLVKAIGNNNKVVVDVVAIHKKKNLNVMEDARRQSFSVYASAIAKNNGGDANVKYGWYGGSPEEIREILLYGFRRFGNREMNHGCGVYLSPANLPMESVKASVADSNGLRYLLLCRVILGKSEEVPFASRKDQPSSMEFNSGVDDLLSPKKYIIWEPYMNTHILPVFIITFKVDSLTGIGSSRITKPPQMNISILMMYLKSYLSSSNMALLKRYQQQYYKTKISKARFVHNLRAIAGDDVLRMIVQNHR